MAVRAGYRSRLRRGRFSVWTKRIGNNPELKMLLLHGGPGFTHEYLEACDSYLPRAGIEYYYYDQLGAGFSDQPSDSSLWELDRFVDEVEQVRRALDLDRENFVLYGQSWGGILAIEYALAHQQHLRGLVISNMMASAPAYTAYATAGAHAGNGSRSARRDTGARGRRRHRESPLHGAVWSRTTTSTTRCACRRAVARPGAESLRSLQPRDLRADARAERARDERRGETGRLGPSCRTSRDRGARRSSSAPATTRWTRTTWR